MLPRLRFLLGYCAFWLALFVLSRAVFLAYEHEQTAELDLATILRTFVYGLRLDLSTMAFVSAIPVLLVAASTFAPARWIGWIVDVYTALALVLVTFIVAGDLEIYRTWGSRVDGGVLTYLESPTKAYASSAASPIALLVGIFVALLAASIAVYAKTLRKRIAQFPPVRPVAGLGVFACSLPLAIAGRGGVGLSPLNVSSAYFSREPFANHAAVNVAWNFLDSVYGAKHDREQHYAFLPAEQAREIVSGLLPPLEPPRRVIDRERPNVVLIIWEALTAKIVEPTGGRGGVTPRFDAACAEGLLFDHLYASGGRSDKGLIAVQSGFPAQPRTSIMRVASKTAKLPVISRTLAAAGWSTGYFYGGELEFANMRSYVVHGGYETVLAKQDFPRSVWNSKWGAHDEHVLRALLEGCDRARQPFFNVTFTLSSHEPYEIPGEPAFPGGGEEAKFLSAMAYTDRCVGEFLEAARRKPWWNDTLVIVVADHGHRMPAPKHRIGRSAPEDYHVPMLWLGGALAVRGEVVGVVGSHTDMINTLLAQLGLPADAYVFGKDLLSPTVVPFAHYSFNDGFGFVTPEGTAVFDNLAKSLIDGRGKVGEPQLRAGQAYQQWVEESYIRL